MERNSVDASVIHKASKKLVWARDILVLEHNEEDGGTWLHVAYKEDTIIIPRALAVVRLEELQPEIGNTLRLYS